MILDRHRTIMEEQASEYYHALTGLGLEWHLVRGFSPSQDLGSWLLAKSMEVEIFIPKTDDTPADRKAEIYTRLKPRVGRLFVVERIEYQGTLFDPTRFHVASTRWLATKEFGQQDVLTYKVLGTGPVGLLLAKIKRKFPRLCLKIETPTKVSVHELLARTPLDQYIRASHGSNNSSPWGGSQESP